MNLETFEKKFNDFAKKINYNSSKDFMVDKYFMMSYVEKVFGPINWISQFEDKSIFLRGKIKTRYFIEAFVSVTKRQIGYELELNTDGLQLKIKSTDFKELMNNLIYSVYELNLDRMNML